MKLADLLGTKYPLIQGGMANIATGEFAAAVSNAGGLGLIAAGSMNAETLRAVSYTHLKVELLTQYKQEIHSVE